MRLAWKLAYGAAARLVARQIRRGEPGCAVYLRGGLAQRELVAGLSDIDLVAVVPSDPGRPGAARERIRTRMARAARRFPVLGEVLLDWPTVHEDVDLRLATGVSTLTYGLGHHQSAGRTVYLGAGVDSDVQRWLERPEMYGRDTAWRLIAGPERRPPDPHLSGEERCLVAWLELQYWWRWAFRLCADPGKPSSPYLAVKLLAEAVRIWVWLTRGEPIATRAQALTLGPLEFPEEAEGFDRARRLYARLHRLPEPPVGLLPSFVRLSARIARAVEGHAAEAGFEEVELTAWNSDELLLPHGGREPESWEGVLDDVPRLLPLLDWRALVSPIEPDETFALVGGELSDPAVIGAVATTFDIGQPYPTLTGDGLMIKPSRLWNRSRLRSVQCRVTDPVSCALVEGLPAARFPRIPGWSIRDVVGRAVAEHGTWLRQWGSTHGEESSATVLGRLLTAARVALVWESVRGGSPRVPLTTEAILTALHSHTAGLATLSEEVRASYRDFATREMMPSERLVLRFRSAVVGLPAYAEGHPAYEAA